jgi:hypothetical protein
VIGKEEMGCDKDVPEASSVVRAVHVVKGYAGYARVRLSIPIFRLMISLFYGKHTSVEVSLLDLADLC